MPHSQAMLLYVHRYQQAKLQHLALCCSTCASQTCKYPVWQVSDVYGNVLKRRQCGSQYEGIHLHARCQMSDVMLHWIACPACLATRLILNVTDVSATKHSLACLVCWDISAYIRVLVATWSVGLTYGGGDATTSPGS